MDVAIEAALATRDRSEDARFRWTAETTVAVDDWWQAMTHWLPDALVLTAIAVVLPCLG